MAKADVADSIAAYHDLLIEHPQLAEDSAAMLQGRQPELRLIFGEKPLCGVLRPQFLSPDTYAEIGRVCGLLTTAMFRMAERIPSDAALQDVLRLTPQERDLVAVDPGYREISPTSRLDSFMAGASWSFVEYNAETPAAIAYEDVLSELFADLPIMKSFGKSHRVTALPARGRLLEVLLDAFHQCGGRDMPTIAVVDWRGLPTASEHQLIADYLQESGCNALLAEPAGLEYSGGRLWADGIAIDIVYRRVLSAELLSQPEAASALLSAYRDHAVCVVNSFRSKLLHKKATFALLSDDRYGAHFTDDERAAISRHIPWTRVVSDSSSTYGGETIDLLEFARANQERLVLKPNDEYGGKGVVIGWESSNADWEASLSRAVHEPTVVQERVLVQRDLFPVWNDGLEWADLIPDLDPFVFGTRVEGMLTRLSAESLLNVTAGTGSLAPTFLVEKQ